MGALAQGFMELHPNVEIISNENTVSIGSIRSMEEQITSENHYVEDLKLRLLSGEEPDLIYDTNDITSEIALSGVLVDLNDYIKSDSTFNEEDFYMNVLDAFKLNGKLYKIPNTTFFQFVRFDTKVLNAVGIDEDTIEAVDYKMIFDVYNKAMETEELPELKYIDEDSASGKAIFVELEFSACFDMEKVEINFNNSEFKEYLEVIEKYTPLNNQLNLMFIDDRKLLDGDEYFVEFVSSYMPAANMLLEEDEGATMAFPLLSSTGDLGISSGASFSIPKNAENPELAWEFIKYCIYESEDVDFLSNIGKWNGDRFFGLVPINKNNAKKYAESAFVTYEEEYVERYLEYISALDNYPLKSLFQFSRLSNSSELIFRDFYDGLMSTDDCIKALQDTADIFIGENN